MKYIITLALILSSAQLLAQWQPEVQLTNNTAESNTTNQSIAVNGGVVHVVWCDKSDEIWQVYYKRSTNGGVSWQAVKRLTNSTVHTISPTISVSGEIVNVFWRDESQHMYQTRSLSAGISWLPHNKTGSTFWWPSVAVSGSTFHLVWSDYTRIYYKRSTNGGSTWNTDTKLYDKFIIQDPPSVAVSGQFVHVVWEISSGSGTSNSRQQIYYKRSTDGGKSWEADRSLPDVQNTSRKPSVAVSGQEVYVVWSDNRNGLTTDIYLKRSPDGGTNWRTDKRLTNHPEGSFHPSISVSGQNVDLIWHNKQLFYNRSINGGVSWGVDTAIANITYVLANPSIFANGQSVHVVWNNTQNIFYKHLLKKSAKKALIPKGQNTTTPDEEKAEDKTGEQKDQKADEPKRDDKKPGEEKQNEKKDTERWVMTTNKDLKGSTGRIVAKLPAEGSMIFHLFNPGKTGQVDPFDTWYSGNSKNLLAGTYDIKVWEALISNVPVEKGKDTRIKLGILSIPFFGNYTVHDTEGNLIINVVGAEKRKLVLPAGKYKVKIAENTQEIEIKDGEVTEF